MHHRTDSGPPCNFLQVGRTERSPHRSGPIMLHHVALAEEPGQNPYRRVSDRVAMQIIDEDAPTAGAPHFPQYLGALGIGQVVKGERTDHGIERLVRKREPRSIADNRLRPAASFSVLRC